MNMQEIESRVQFLASVELLSALSAVAGRLLPPGRVVSA